jgi:hypothetical protein
MPNTLIGKIALVTGGSRGIGAAVVRRLGVRQIENPGRGGRGFRGDEQGGKTRSSSQCLNSTSQ